MRNKLFIGSAIFFVLAVATVAFAGVFAQDTQEPVKAAQVSTPAKTCCPDGDCCQECLDCCAEDGCCDECILCCILMGCDPSCCFPAQTTKGTAPQTCNANAKNCSGAGCCK